MDNSLPPSLDTMSLTIMHWQRKERHLVYDYIITRRNVYIHNSTFLKSTMAIYDQSANCTYVRYDTVYHWSVSIHRWNVSSRPQEWNGTLLIYYLSFPLPSVPNVNYEYTKANIELAHCHPLTIWNIGETFMGNSFPWHTLILLVICRRSFFSTRVWKHWY